MTLQQHVERFLAEIKLHRLKIQLENDIARAIRNQKIIDDLKIISGATG